MPAVKPLRDKTVAVTAERRASHQIRYLNDRGATTLWAPVLQTTDARNHRTLLTATDRLIEQPPHYLIVQTGQGFQWWLDGANGSGRGKILDVLASSQILTRGSKASNAVRKVGLKTGWQAPSETVADIIDKVGQLDLAGRTVAIQLDGNETPALVEATQSAGAKVVELDVYRYRLPTDLKPSLALIDLIVENRIDAVTFTASPAVRQLREIANSKNLLKSLDAKFSESTLSESTLAVVVGPVCAEAARDASWRNIVEPSSARLIPMLEALTERLSAS